MKKTLAVLALLSLLILTACGNSNADALQQENETLRQQVAALEAENENLYHWTVSFCLKEYRQVSVCYYYPSLMA